MDACELEGVARWLLEETGVSSPVDAFDLIDVLEMKLEHEHGPRSWWTPGVVHLGLDTPTKQVHSKIAHECAHELLHRCRIANIERNARYLGAALLVPRTTLDRQLRAGWDLDRLLAYHVNASAELLARRITDIRRASLAVYDRGRFRYRVGSATPLGIERALVQQALDSRAPVRVDDLNGAWPVFDGDFDRVLVLAAG